MLISTPIQAINHELQAFQSLFNGLEVYIFRLKLMYLNIFINFNGLWV